MVWAFERTNETIEQRYSDKSPSDHEKLARAYTKLADQLRARAERLER